MAYDNIPNELKQLAQWVCWRYEQTDTGKLTKLPYNPRNGQLASVTDPRTWSTFDEACAATWNGYAGIGFVFTAYDRYCGIDLDATDDAEAYERQVKIFEAMNSYSELSPSGNGLHIIVKAELPHGRKRASVEIYSKERYFTFTGNVYRDAPIEDRQELAQLLWEEMGSGAQPDYYAGDAAPKAFDDEVFEQARRAANGEKFMQLWNGEWRQDYPSQSDADLALMNIIVFHTKNRAQAARMFLASALGQRDKAKRHKYIEYTLDKAFDMTLPPINLDALINQINETVAANRLQQRTAVDYPQPNPYSAPGLATNPARTFEGVDIDMWRRVDPPGVLKDMMDFVYAQAPRQVREIALTASIGLLAGVTGRAYNVSGTGLNLYIMMLAETGRGKEAMASGVNRLMSAVAGTDFPAAWDFVGPSDMASGSGLLKHLAERAAPSICSLTGEIGMRLQQMAAPNANMADKTLQRVLLDLYAKSGAGQVVRPTVYSDKKNNIEMINSPAFTWLGESTPSEFYKALNEHQISSGLLPRFMIVEYQGNRPPLNERHEQVYPSQAVIHRLRDVVDVALKANNAGQVINVGMTTEARELSKMIDLYCDHKINSISTGPIIQLWNRAHLKVLKLAALLAVSHNHHTPLIDKPMLEWSLSLVMTDVLGLSGRFERGDVGESTTSEAAGVMSRGIVLIAQGNVKLNATESNLFNHGVVSRSTLSRLCLSYRVFKEDKRLFGETIEEVIKQGALNRLSKLEAATQFNSTAELFQVSNMQWFYDHVPLS